MACENVIGSFVEPFRLFETSYLDDHIAVALTEYFKDLKPAFWL
jgi:hypothetical protein